MIYRAEIDGLRSLAIIPVLLYHAYLTISGVRIFSGGYLGVDIFFVISGYLITKILIDELFDQEKISITQFYERRIRRIIPNLLLVLLFTLIASTFILSPGDLTGIALQALSAIFFVSNFYFYTWGRVEYGQAESTEHALLHTWSLAVEEQFYLLFPIVLIVLFFLHKRSLFIYARYFIFVIIVSYVLAIILSDWKPVFNFYLIFSRAWELLIGSMLVLIERLHPIKKNPSSLIGTFGLLLIIIPMLMMNSASSHPSAITIIPIIGTAIIIRYGASDSIVQKVLANKLAVFIGLISYSLYLWHYPIFVLLETASANFLLKISSLVLAFILAMTAYYVFENILRSKVRVSRKKFYLTIAALLVANLIMIYAIISSDGFKDRWEVDGVGYDNNEYIDEWNDSVWPLISTSDFPSNNKKNILFIGNSVNADVYRAFVEGDENKSYNLRVIKEQIGCIRSHLDEVIYRECPNFNSPTRYHQNYLPLMGNADVIVFGTLWNHQTEFDFSEIALVIPRLQELQTKNVKIILLSSPELPIIEERYTTFSSFTYFLFKNKRMPSQLELRKLEENAFNYHEGSIKNKKMNKTLQQIAEKNNVSFINRTIINCDMKSRICPIAHQSKPLFWDYIHLTDEGVQFFKQKVFEVISKDL